jgi:GTP cyclohydrolase III
LKNTFIAIDGDDVGHKLEYYMLINDQSTLNKFSTAFSNSMNWLEDKLSTDFSATVIFTGGDNLLARLDANAPNNLPEILELLRLEFSNKSQSTLSIGIGRSPREAYLALKLAKASGKNCIRLYEEFPND